MIIFKKKKKMILGDGSLMSFGSNDYGQLGTGDGQNRNLPHLLLKDNSINHISCGGEYFVFSKSKIKKKI